VTERRIFREEGGRRCVLCAKKGAPESGSLREKEVHSGGGAGEESIGEGTRPLLTVSQHVEIVRDSPEKYLKKGEVDSYEHGGEIKVQKGLMIDKTQKNGALWAS